MRPSIPRRFTVWIAIAGTVAAVAILALPTSGLALPAYTSATGQPCSTCHVNPAGGGTLTSTGQAFAAIPTHASNPSAAFAQVSGAAAPAKPAAPAPAAAPAAPAAAPAPARLPAAGDGGGLDLALALAAGGILALFAGMGLVRRRT